MHWLEDYPLDALNTLRLPARARHFCRLEAVEEIGEAIAFARARSLPLRVLGGGSNVVLRDRIEACVLQMALAGVDLLEEDAQLARVRVAAGTDWHGFVQESHRRGWHGLENLALIPGTVGAAPMQNIGAYGVEAGEFIESVSLIEIATGAARELDAAECRFGYRDSIFKQSLAGSVLITAVTFRLPRQHEPRIAYPALRAELAGTANPTSADVLDAVIRIRRQRLPDPAQLPNAGSFFKNPLLPRAEFESLRERFPGIVGWPAGEHIKLAAAWLVENAGWKGRRLGDAGVHAQHALVLVNHGHAGAAELLELAAQICASVRERFGVGLEIEPVVV